MAKKKNVADTTLRNLRASKRREGSVKLQLDELFRRVRKIENLLSGSLGRKF